MKKILFFLIAGVAAISANAQDTFNGAVAGQSYNFTTSASVASTYSWTETVDANNIATFGSATNTNNITIDIAAGPLTNGWSATVSAVATSTTTPACPGAARTLTVVVGNASFTATIAATQSVCQNAAATVAVTLAESNAAATTITGFSYYIDADNNGIRNGAEALVAGTVASDVAGSITLNTATSGTQNIIISSISGTQGAAVIVSAVPNTVAQVVTINELPVLNTISPL